MGKRTDDLVARLDKGARKTDEFFARLTEEQSGRVIYTEPGVWTVRDVLAHFLSAEVALLRLAQDIVAGGPGAPPASDYDAFNAQEQARLAGLPSTQLRPALTAARAATIAWLSNLSDQDLDRVGRHPALGEINLETFVNVMYGHQLMHIRDLARLLA